MNNDGKSNEINFQPGNIGDNPYSANSNINYGTTGNTKINSIDGNATVGGNPVNGTISGNGFNNIGNEMYAETDTGVPAKVSIWTKLKSFLFQDSSERKANLTPKEQKFINFWKQDVTVDKVYNFLFQEIKFK